MTTEHTPEEDPIDTSESPSQPEQEWTGTEDTMIGVPAGATQPQATESAHQWTGSEDTMIGVPASGAHPPASEDAEGQWTGSEATMVGVSTSDGAVLDGDPEAWTGSEATMVGMGTDDAEDWDGSEATMAGIPAGAVNVGQESGTKPGEESETGTKGGTTTGTKTKGSVLGTGSFNDGWHLKGEKGLATGQTWGDYEIGGILGQGGMGTVYRGRHKRLARRVAVKVLPPHLASNEDLRIRFEMEAQAASMLSGDYVVQVFDAGTELGTPYYIMEFVEGKDLEIVIEDHKKEDKYIDPHAAADYIIQSGRGLVEAAKHDFVHRDIKPPNLMLTDKGVIKIADFGIVKVLGESNLTLTGTTVGTPAYVSPEQGRGEDVDARSDLYSLGCCFYELLTNEKPFDGKTPSALIYQHNYEEPELPTKINSNVPEAYQAVVIKMMQKDPDKRYATAAEMVADLETIRLGNAPITAILAAAKLGTGADDMMKRMGMVQSNLKKLLWIAAAVLMIVGLGTWYVIDRNDKKVEIENLKVTLAPLDNPEPLPIGYEESFKRLQDLAGESDEVVNTWKKKVEKVSKIESDILTQLSKDEATQSEIDWSNDAYSQYVAQVGTEAVMATEFKNYIEQETQDIQNLKKELSGIDQKENHTEAGWKKYGDDLILYGRLVGEKDPSYSRWSGIRNVYNEEIAIERTALSQLSDVDGIIKKDQLDKLQKILNRFVIRVGENNSEYITHKDFLEQRFKTYESLRKKMEKEHKDDFISEVALERTAASVTDFSEHAPKDDVVLERVQTVRQNSIDRIKDTKNKLRMTAANDASYMNDDKNDRYLRYTKSRESAEYIKTIKDLVKSDDEELNKWEGEVDKTMERYASLMKNVKRFLRRKTDGDILKKVEQNQAREYIKDLEELGATEDVEIERLQDFITDEEAEIDRLVSFLSPIDKIEALPEGAAEKLELYLRYMGRDDVSYVKWNDKVNQVEGELRYLKDALDGPIEIPDDVQERMERLATLIGSQSIQYGEWAKKIKRVAEIEEQLEILNEAIPLPVNVDKLLSELSKETGTTSKQYKKWLKKVNRVREIKGSLGELNTLVILPPETKNLILELESLVGEKDEKIQQLKPQYKNLYGPVPPEWANADTFKRGDDYGIYAELLNETLPSIGFRYVPYGEFMLGAKGGKGDETSIEMGISKAFWISETECTQALYTAVMGHNPSKFAGKDEHPVERVSYNDLVLFFDKLNQQIPGLNARLPKEIEWEYACRAGTAAGDGSQRADFVYSTHIADEDRDVRNVAWYEDNSGDRTHPVKERLPNPLGLFDMQGNVWEWCLGKKTSSYPTVKAVDWEGKEGDLYVVRGGSWRDPASSCRTANRHGIAQTVRSPCLGFRIVVEVQMTAELPLEHVAEQEEAILEIGAEIPDVEEPVAVLDSAGELPESLDTIAE